MIRIQKFLANQGVFSRRQADQAICDGRVLINGQRAQLGQVLEPNDRIQVDGKMIYRREIDHQLLLYNKPCGKICSQAASDRERSIWRDFPRLKGGKWISVGRLDLNTSGLMLITTDGDLANRLMHPSANLERVYKVRVLGEVNARLIEKMERGVMLDDGVGAFKKIKLLNDTKTDKVNQWFEVTVTSGRYRMVRRIFQACDLTVNRLIRVRYGPLILPTTLKKGHCMNLSAQDIEMLKKQITRYRQK